MRHIESVLLVLITLETVPPLLGDFIFILLLDLLHKLIRVDDGLAVVALDEVLPLAHDLLGFDFPVVLVHHQFGPQQLEAALLGVEGHAVLVDPVEVWRHLAVTHPGELLELVRVVLTLLEPVDLSVAGKTDGLDVQHGVVVDLVRTQVEGGGHLFGQTVRIVIHHFE